MKPFIKVTGLTKDFFSDREYEQDIIIGLNQISAIYEEQIVIGESKYVKLTPESMERLKEYIECADFTSKGGDRMSDKVKLIIEIPKPMYETVQNGTYCGTLYEELKNGVPLDDVKAEIHEKVADYVARGYADSAEDFEEYSRIVNQTFDNIGKGES